jgi:lactoylglutathione lyase
VVTRIQTVVLNVSDVPAAAAFYEGRLGLDRVYESRGRVGLQCGEVRILLHPSEIAPPRDVAPWNVELYFEVDDVDQAVARLRNEGVGVLAEPADEPWGERDAAVLDPDGYPVYLTQSLPGSWTETRA